MNAGNGEESPGPPPPLYYNNGSVEVPPELRMVCYNNNAPEPFNMASNMRVIEEKCMICLGPSTSAMVFADDVERIHLYNLFATLEILERKEEIDNIRAQSGKINFCQSCRDCVVMLSASHQRAVTSQLEVEAQRNFICRRVIESRNVSPQNGNASTSPANACIGWIRQQIQRRWKKFLVPRQQPPEDRQ